MDLFYAAGGYEDWLSKDYDSPVATLIDIDIHGESVGYCEQPLESDTYLEYGATAAYYGHGSGGGRHSSDSGESSHAVMSRAHFAADLAAGEATSPSRVARSAAAGRGSTDSSYLSAVVKGVKRQREDRDCGAGASADSHHLASEDSHSVKLTREERRRADLERDRQKFKPHSIKASIFQVLEEAGPRGLQVAQIVEVTQERGMKDWRGVLTPKCTVSASCCTDPVFVRVAPGTFALRALLDEDVVPPRRPPAALRRRKRTRTSYTTYA